MLSVLNLLFLGGTALADIALQMDQAYQIPEQDSVVAVSMQREWWREDGVNKCRYTGYAFPVVRDWEIVEIRDGIEYRDPPDLKDRYGVAVVTTKKVCEGKPVEHIFRTGLERRLFKVDVLQKHSTVRAQDYYSLKEEFRPKWLPQVFERLERLSATDEVAKIALTDIQAGVTAVTEQRNALAEAENAKKAGNPESNKTEAQTAEGS